MEKLANNVKIYDFNIKPRDCEENYVSNDHVDDNYYLTTKKGFRYIFYI